MSNFVNYVKNRLHRQNRNFIAVIVGATGSGKSYCALRLAEKIDEDFTLEQVVFTPQEFMDLLNSGKLKRGSVIVFDESGVAVNSRNFQTATNKLMHYVNQTFRSNNYAVIYTLPDFSFLDLGIRKLAHVLLETRRIDYARQRCWVKPLMIENNPQSGKVYLKYPRFRSAVNPRQMNAITRMYFEKPSDKLIEAYEARKVVYNKKLQLDVQTNLNRPKAVEKAKPDLQAIAQAVKENPAKYIDKKGKINRGLLAQEFGIGTRRMDMIQQLLPSLQHTTVHNHQVNANTTTKTKQIDNSEVKT